MTRLLRLVCRLFGHSLYVCREPDCADFGRIVCRTCGWSS